MHDSLTAWQLRVPQLEATWDALRARLRALGRPTWRRCACAAGTSGLARLPAAGMPWFMTVFGRDTLITSLQTLLFGPELARGALEVLAELQAPEDDPSIDAEPGKIVHEVRHGKAAKVWFHSLLRHRRRDAALPRAALGGVALDAATRRSPTRLREPALRALAWIDEHGDLDGDGFVEYRRRTERGLENQSWKDSGDSQRFADGRLAAAADRPVRGAGLRLRREAADGRARARGLARRGARRAARRAEADRAQRALRRGVLGRGARRVLRARARRREGARRLAVLEHRPPALERDRPRRSGPSRSSPR